MAPRHLLRGGNEIAPDEIFLDSSNLPSRDDHQFEARLVRPLGRQPIIALGVTFALVVVVFATRAFDLSVVHGEVYAEVSRENRLAHSVLFAVRGTVTDRTGRKLAWSEMPENTATTTVAVRRYTNLPGLALLLGFVRYPKTDESGAWWREETLGVSGAELAFNTELAGRNGSSMVEIDARGNVENKNIVEPPQHGKDIALSIDAEIQNNLFSYMSAHAVRQGFVGGAAAMMDVRSGELVALTSFPEYDNQAFTEGLRAVVAKTASDPRSPLLNRAVAGLYTPGSIVKPILAAAALQEGLITPEATIVSTGAISVPNPYDPSRPSIYRDWTVHGSINMREALAVSSDEYFYTIGGGYGAQKGLGIQRIDAYATQFGLGSPSGIELMGEEAGVVPTPAWKAATFGPDDPWRIGNTYHTAIGQYGFQITLLQAVSFVAAIANGGKLFRPTIRADFSRWGGLPYREVGVDDAYLQVVREGMRLAITSQRQDATVKILNIPGISIAAKTGTAQIGANNEWVNSWSVGFWPADQPRYAYAAVLERARAGTLSGAAPGLRPFFEWLVANKPEYVN